MLVLPIILAFALLTAGFARYLVRSDQGEHEPRRALWMAFGMGLVAVIPIMVMEWLIIGDVPEPGQFTGHQLITTALQVGAIEETCKFLPLAFVIYHKRYFNEHTDGVLYFALAGLSMGLVENIGYTLSYGPKAGIPRLLLMPFFHAATTAVVGSALVKVKLDKRPVWTVAAVLLLMIVLHAADDGGLFSGLLVFMLMSVAITIGLTVNLFAMVYRARYEDQKAGLSAVGNNSFCRSCGHPNPKHWLYCTACGVRA